MMTFITKGKKNDPVKKYKKKLIKKINFSQLVKIVKSRDLTKSIDFCKMKFISNCIFELWIELKEKYRKKAIKEKYFCERLYDEMEAEEQILMSLLYVLNEKLLRALQIKISH